MIRKQIFSRGSATVTVISGLLYVTRRAVIQNIDVFVERAGHDPSVAVELYYSAGLRPWSVIIDILALNGASGSATVDGEQERITVPLSTSFEGRYTLTTTATYRILGVPRVVTSSYSNTLHN